MDKLDKHIKIKQFLNTIYRDIDFGQEFIRVLQQNGDYNKVTFYNNVDDLINSVLNKYNKCNNTYFQLATTDDIGGSCEHLKYRYCLALDFDKKDLGQDFNHKDIINKFRELKIYCHAIVDSGNGYHAYIIINKTDKLDMVQKVQESLCDKLNADKNAIKSTQILRIPYTYNVKDKAKMVRIVHLANRHDDKFKAYDIEFLYSKNCTESTSSKKIEYTLNTTNIPKCIQSMLENGSTDGDRYKDLCNIVVYFRNCNKQLTDIKQIVKEWALKSNYNENLDYKIEHIYNNKNSLELECNNCTEQENCFKYTVSDFEYSNEDKLITLCETNISKLKYNNRKGAKVMNSNDILIYGVLKLHNDGLTIDEIMKELTYTKRKVVKNVALSEKYVRAALNNLESNNFITIIKGNARKGIKNIYVIKQEKSKIELTYNISYSATMECIKGNISIEELRLYNYMRYLHHKEQRENPKSLKGNLFQFNQTDLAKELGLTQQRISQMIINLLDEKLLSVWYRQPSKNNGYEYYIYRLIY